MKHKVTVLEVRIRQDPMIGWGHQASDHVEWLQKHLNSMIPHYKPEVKLVSEEILEMR